MRKEQEIMKAASIREVNEAIMTLRHFVSLSARLLPFLYELHMKKRPSKDEIEDKKKIIDVYLNHSFDTVTSKTLMNSDILERIQITFHAILVNDKNSKKRMKTFLTEHDRLKENWNYIDAN